MLDFAERISHPQLKSLFHLWAGRREERQMPPPDAMVLSSLPLGLQAHAFSFRVCGRDTQAAESLHRPLDLTSSDGDLLFECTELGHEAQLVLGDIAHRPAEQALRGQIRHVLLRVLNATAVGPVVHYYHKTLTVTGGGQPLLESKLLLPLSVDGIHCDAVIGGVYRTLRDCSGVQAEVPPYDCQTERVDQLEHFARSVHSLTSA